VSKVPKTQLKFGLKLLCYITFQNVVEQCFSTCATVRTSADEKVVRCGWQT